MWPNVVTSTEEIFQANNNVLEEMRKWSGAFERC